MEKVANNFCVVPFVQMEVGPFGDFRPCCEYQGSLGNIKKQSFFKAFNSNPVNHLRKQFNNNEIPKGCKTCFVKEQTGVYSRRQQENKMYNIEDITDSPIMLDLKFGNRCNMKCRICCTENSHLWESDELEIFGRPLKTQKNNWVDIPERWNELELLIDNLQTIYISGGEPLLLKENFRLIEQCVEKDKAKNIFLRIVTNGSVRIPEKVLELFKNFKKVTIMYSIDDIGNRFTYQRHPIKFEKVENNFKDILNYDFLDIRITYSVSIYNCLSGQDFTNWCDKLGYPVENIYVNFVTNPSQYDISMLSDNHKKLVVKELKDNIIDQKIQQYIFAQHNENDVDENTKLRQLLISKLDKLRSESFNKTFPKMSEILNV